MDIPDIIATYDKSAKEYAKDQLGKTTKELPELLGHVKSGSKVLDIGCAAGRDTRIMKDLGFDATGVDLSTELLKIARANNPDIPFITADMRDLPFPDHSFAALWINAVLHHLNREEMADAVREFYRVLEHKGLVCIRTKKGSGKLTTEESMVQGQAREFTLLTEDALDSILSSNGFSKLSIEAKESGSRKGLFWLTAVYRKSN